MRVVVTGGRDFASPAFVWCGLDVYHEHFGITDLMHGACPTGVDKFAREWGRFRGVQVWRCEAEWEKYGLAAGPRRNRKMMTWRPDFVLAFPGNRGTAGCIEAAREAGIQVLRVAR